MPAFFNGQPIFGIATEVKTSNNPRSIQKTMFAGVSGVDTLDLGLHGRVTDIKTLLFGQDAPTLNAAITILRSYQDGQLYTFVDSFSNIWPFCLLESIEPTSKVICDPNQGFFQAFSVRIFHAF